MTDRDIATMRARWVPFAYWARSEDDIADMNTVLDALELARAQLGKCQLLLHGLHMLHEVRPLPGGYAQDVAALLTEQRVI